MTNEKKSSADELTDEQRVFALAAKHDGFGDRKHFNFTGAEMLEFTRALWSYPDRWWTEGDILHLSTGGWSGNESLIYAMQENRMFWAICWESSRRGGHYTFDLSRTRELAA